MEDFIPIVRAARIVAPISEGLHHNRFESGQFEVLRMLGNADVVVKAATAPPVFPSPETLQGGELSKEWFYSIQNHRHGDGIRDWNVLFIDWMRTSLLICHADLRANLESPAGKMHERVSHVDTAGATWNFPETLAWIATRDPLEVARMRCASHWEAPISDDDEWASTRALIQNDRMRSMMIGWLVVATANQHCKCGSAISDEQEAWETCHCVGVAYDELRRFVNGTSHPIPEYQPKPTYASFTLTWPDGAHNISFLRSDVLEHWPAALSTNWTDELIEIWWREGGFTDGKKARNAFMKLDGTQGMSASFQTLWKEKHPNSRRGRRNSES